jgi:hypothetical protein
VETQHLDDGTVVVMTDDQQAPVRLQKPLGQHSETIGTLGEALAKAQAEMPTVPESGHNPHFDSYYPILSDIFAAIRQPLANHGLSVIHTIEQTSGTMFVVARLIHSSGEWIQSRCPIQMGGRQQGMQALGSAISYARRYTLTALVGVASASEDDDASLATGTTVGAAHENSTQSQPPRPSANQGQPQDQGPKSQGQKDGLTPQQTMAIESLLDETGSDRGKFLQYMGAESIMAIPQSKYDVAIQALEAKQKKES